MLLVGVPNTCHASVQADGISIEAAGLRGLPQLFLVEIERATGKKIAAVSPQETLHGGDVLWFAGVLESVASLRKIPGKIWLESVSQIFSVLPVFIRVRSSCDDMPWFKYRFEASW